MLLLLRRHDRQRDRGQLAAQGQAGIVPEKFGDAKVVPQPVGGINCSRVVAVGLGIACAVIRRPSANGWYGM